MAANATKPRTKVMRIVLVENRRNREVGLGDIMSATLLLEDSKNIPRPAQSPYQADQTATQSSGQDLLCFTKPGMRKTSAPWPQSLSRERKNSANIVSCSLANQQSPGHSLAGSCYLKNCSGGRSLRESPRP